MLCPGVGGSPGRMAGCSSPCPACSTSIIWLQAHLSLPPQKHFYGHSQAPWLLWDGRQEPSSPLLMRKPYPAATGAPTLPPWLPSGCSTAPAWRGNPPPHLPQGSEAAGLPCIPAVVSGFGVQAPGVTPLSPHIPVGVSSAPRHSLPPVQQTVSHCRWFTPASPSASSASSKIPFWPVIAAPRPRRLWGRCAGGAGLPLPELPWPPLHSQPPPCLYPVLWHQPFPRDTRAQGLPAKPTSGARCPAPLALPGGAASHVPPMPCWWHHPRRDFARGRFTAPAGTGIVQRVTAVNRSLPGSWEGWEAAAAGRRLSPVGV